MNTIDLKHEPINRISNIEDVDILNDLKTFMDNKKYMPFIELSADQEKELLIARDEGHSGNYISQSEMDKKVDSWLKE